MSCWRFLPQPDDAKFNVLLVKAVKTMYVFGIVDNQNNHSTIYICVWWDSEVKKYIHHSYNLLWCTTLKVCMHIVVPCHHGSSAFMFFLTTMAVQIKNFGLGYGYVTTWNFWLWQDKLKLMYIHRSSFSVAAKSYNSTDVFNIQELAQVLAQSENINISLLC